MAGDVAYSASAPQLRLVSSDHILYRRRLPQGPEVRLRRTTPAGATPVVLVLDVERRAGTPREGTGTPPPLKQVAGASEEECVALLRPDADDDRAVAALMRALGQR